MSNFYVTCNVERPVDVMERLLVQEGFVYNGWLVKEVATPGQPKFCWLTFAAPALTRVTALVDDPRRFGARFQRRGITEQVKRELTSISERPYHYRSTEEVGRNETDLYYETLMKMTHATTLNALQHLAGRALYAYGRTERPESGIGIPLWTALNDIKEIPKLETARTAAGMELRKFVQSFRTPGAGTVRRTHAFDLVAALVGTEAATALQNSLRTLHGVDAAIFPGVRHVSPQRDGENLRLIAEWEKLHRRGGAEHGSLE